MKYLLKFLFSALLLTSCSSKSEKPLVLVSIAPYQKIVEQLVGDFAEVEVVVPEKVDLHLFEPKPSDAKKLVGAKVWFGTGEPFEQKLLPSLKQHSGVDYVNLSKVVPLAKESEGLCKHGHAHDHEHHHHVVDLHIWMSPVMMIDQVAKMAAVLSDHFPNHVGEITENAGKLKYQLERLDARIAHHLAPYKGQSILVAHPCLGYYCHQYGLKQLSLECEGKEPSPKDVERLLAKLKHTTLRCAFIQDQYSSKAVKTIAHDLTTPIHTIDPYSSDYFENMMKITNDIVQ